ncbi:hypothetical protein FK513_30425, partial [Klebsiella pneumoniae]|nr:hypothetical protein [Klebsiella pneumoniae]
MASDQADALREIAVGQGDPRISGAAGGGGGGGNAVEHMVRERIEGVEFFAVNTDAQALRKTAVGQTNR